MENWGVGDAQAYGGGAHSHPSPEADPLICTEGLWVGVCSSPSPGGRHG